MYPSGRWTLHFDKDTLSAEVVILLCDGLVRGMPHSGAVRVSEHWDQPYMQGTGQSRGPSKSSGSAVQVALQGLTCEKKTKSILVEGANLYSNGKMT